MSYRHPQEGGGSLEVLDEGISLTEKADSVDVVGSGATATNVGDAVTLTVPGGAGRTSKDETPSGTINSSNKVFTLASTPDTDSLKLFLNGIYQTPGGVDYTLSGSTITYVTAPETGSKHQAKYEV